MMYREKMKRFVLANQLAMLPSRRLLEPKGHFKLRRMRLRRFDSAHDISPHEKVRGETYSTFQTEP